MAKTATKKNKDTKSIENKVSKETVRKVALLSNLSLTDAEIDYFSKEFTGILDTINVLSELNLKDTKETYQVNNLVNIYQSPENTVTLTQEEALSNARDVVDGCFATSAVFDRE